MLYLTLALGAAYVLKDAINLRILMHFRFHKSIPVANLATEIKLKILQSISFGIMQI